MSDKEISSLLIWCGALHDIAENSHEKVIAKQIREVEKRIELLMLKYII